MTFPLSIKENILRKALKLSQKNVDVLFFDKYTRGWDFFDNDFLGVFINGKMQMNANGVINFFYKTTTPYKYKNFNFRGLVHDVSDCGECLPLKLENPPKYYVAKRFWYKDSFESFMFKKKAVRACDFTNTTFRVAKPRKKHEEKGEGVFVVEGVNLQKLEEILKEFPKDRYIGGFEDVHILPMMRSVN